MPAAPLAPPLVACSCAGGLPRELKREAAEELAARTRLKPAEVKALYARFRRLAPLGFLLPEQFRQTLGVLGLSDDHFLPDRLFRVFDSNQDGQLCFDEFATSLAVMLRGTEDEKLRLSFEMASGRGNGISFEDFRHLIRACSAMKSNLIAPSSGHLAEEDIQRLFRDVAGAAGEEQVEAAVITLEAYKAAVHSNSEFLDCLGLSVRQVGTPPEQPGGELPRRFRSTSTPTSPQAAQAPSLGPSELKSEGHVLLPTGELEELLGHVEGLRKAMRGGAGDDAAVVVEEELEGFGSSGDELPPTPTRCAPLKLQVMASSGRPSSIADPAPVALSPLGEVWKVCCRVVEGTLGAVPSCKPLCGEPREHEIDFRATPRPECEAAVRPASGRSPRCASSAPVLLGGAVQAEVNHLLSWCQRHGASCDGPASRCGGGRCGGRCGGKGKEAAGLLNPVVPSTTASSPRPSARLHPGDCEDGGGLALPRNSPRKASLRSGLSRRPSFLVQRSEGACAGAKGRRRAQAQHRLRLLGPKKGLAVHFGHENWNMVLSMMIGIRMSIGRCRHEIPRELQPVDFVMKEKFTIIPRLTNIFDSAASKRITITRFIDYAPMVFLRIRQSFGIQHDEYLRSVGPEQLLGNMVLGNLSSLAELSSEGKSGAFFYYTADGRYMMKTVAQKEYHLLRNMLSGYYEHIMQNPGTLIVRFLGLHCLSIRERRRGSKGAHHTVQKLYFVVMANMFNTPFEIHRRYDLKGSWVGRFTPHEARDRTVALKDVDFTEANESIRVGEEARSSLLAQIQSDSVFLRDNNIIDYSLLLGIHDVSSSWDGVVTNLSNPILAEWPPTALASRNSASVDRTQSPASCSPVCSPGASPTARAARLGLSRLAAGGAGAQAEAGQASARVVPLHQRDLGGLLSSDRKSLYFLGVIDILTPYDSAKRLEHGVKALLYDRKGVSCCEPGFYAERFTGFMQNAFV